MGNQEQCAALVQDLSPGVGGTTSWTKGSCDLSSLAAGTPIATFGYDSSGNFVGYGSGTQYGGTGCQGGCSGSSHTAIYLGMNDAGQAVVLQQWASSSGRAQVSALSGSTAEMSTGSYCAIAGAKIAQGFAGAGSATSASSSSSSSGGVCTSATPTSNAYSEGQIDPTSIAYKVYLGLTQQTNGINPCWGCAAFQGVIDATDTIASQSFQYITGGSSYEQGTSSFIKLVAVMVAIAVVWKLAILVGSPLPRPMVAGSVGFEEILSLIVRFTVILVVFFSASSLSDMQDAGSSFGSEQSMNRTLFVNGPLAVGTAVGCKLGNVAADALGVAEMGCSGGVDWRSDQDANAQSILMGFHRIGAAGAALGIYISAYVASIVVRSTNMAGVIQGFVDPFFYIAIGVVGLAGIAMTCTLIAATVSFALRYVDAALRAMVAMAFMPIFLILWVFRSTRPVALAAFKAVLFMMGLFAVGGISYAIGAFIIKETLTLLNASGSVDIASGGQSLGQAILGMQSSLVTGSAPSFLGGIGNSFGMNSVAGFFGATNSAGSITMNWTAYFIIVSGLSFAIAMMHLPFYIADGLIAFSVRSHNMAMSGAYESTDQNIKDFAAQAQGRATGAVGDVTSYGAGMAWGAGRAGVRGAGGVFGGLLGFGR